MNESFRADLHSHTTVSDGMLSPKALIDAAVEVGLSALSITDHDTVGAYTDETVGYAKEKGLQLVRGVEVSSFFFGESIHVLGYRIGEMKNFLERMRVRREGRNREILEKLDRLRRPISEEELGPLDKIGRPHIAMAMVAKGYVESLPAAFIHYLKEGAAAYCTGEIVETKEAIAAIQSEGGIAVLAHPHFIRKKRTIESLLELPFNGIECYYGSYPRKEEEKFITLAKERGLLITGGSDYHGHDNKHAQLGSSWVGKDDYEALIRAKA